MNESSRQIEFRPNLEDLKKSAEKELQSVKSDELAKASSDSLAQEAESLRHDRYKSDTRDRRWLAEWSTTIVTLWLFMVVFILFNNNQSIHLSDTVLSVLLGTTTLNVLGLTAIVLRGHFFDSK